MTMSMTEQENSQATILAQLDVSTAPLAGPGWLQTIREAALARFNELGLPTTKDEDWRFTNIAPIRDTAFVVGGNETTLSSADVDAKTIPGLDAHQLVFVDGVFNAGLSTIQSLPAGVEVMSLAQAIETLGPLLEKHFGQLADIENDAFTALNTALANHGGVVHVPDKTTVDTPIYVLNIAASDKPLLTNPRNLIIVGDHANVTFIEDYVALHDGVYLNNTVTEIFVGDNADATHYFLEKESESAFNMCHRCTSGRDVTAGSRLTPCCLAVQSSATTSSQFSQATGATRCSTGCT